jgi:hypothetical protein
LLQELVVAHAYTLSPPQREALENLAVGGKGSRFESDCSPRDSAFAKDRIISDPGRRPLLCEMVSVTAEPKH